MQLCEPFWLKLLPKYSTPLIYIRVVPEVRVLHLVDSQVPQLP